MSAIRIEALRKTYGSVIAVAGLTLAVEENTVFGFLGPNGAGKTTTIRILTGLAHPTSGRAWVGGEPASYNHRAANRFGYLPEDPAFYNWMTPEELLLHIGRLFSLNGTANRARTEELLKQVGLHDVRKRRIGGFSRGMRQRLGLAQALVNHPPVLFLDEPASALDPAGRKEVLDLITELRGQCTVFMSTHILADVERVCDTIAILNKGRLIVEARQAELLDRYSSPAFEMEPDPACAAAFGEWAKTLEALPWVSGVTPAGSGVRVVARDLSQAHQALLPLAVQAGLVLHRYEVVTPSLEDIFLRLTNGKEQAL
jgi:ABC-2 type transport system ATP-binding protein